MCCSAVGFASSKHAKHVVAQHYRYKTVRPYLILVLANGVWTVTITRGGQTFCRVLRGEIPRPTVRAAPPPEDFADQARRPSYGRPLMTSRVDRVPTKLLRRMQQ